MSTQIVTISAGQRRVFIADQFTVYIAKRAEIITVRLRAGIQHARGLRQIDRERMRCVRISRRN